MSTCYIDTNPQFQPAVRLITAVTLDNPAAVTTSTDHGYVTGTIVRFEIPECVGMQQLHKQQATITVTGPDTFTIDINTIDFDVFAIPGAPRWFDNTCALVVPIGENGFMFTAAVQDITV